MSNLIVSHNLFLTHDQKYSWYNGDEQEVVGVSIPVWIDGKGTSEPASEVFAKYKLYIDAQAIIKKNGQNKYEIYLPRDCQKLNIGKDIWNQLSFDEKDSLYQMYMTQPCIKSILKIEDGGSNWLAFKQKSKIRKNKKTFSIMHFVEIHDISDFINSCA